MIPSKADKNDYDLIMSTENRTDVVACLRDTNICNAYKYFYNYCLDKKDNMETLVAKLSSETNCLVIITLEAFDDEQQIFDSVNSLGKTLSSADIIKNFLFQRMMEMANNETLKNQVINRYNQNWHNVFYANEKRKFWYEEISIGRIKTDNLELFLRDFGIVKHIYSAYSNEGFNGLFKQYKNYLLDKSLTELFALSDEMKQYAETYYGYHNDFENIDGFIWGDTKNRILLILNELDISTFNAYILKLFNDNPEDLNERLFRLEKFILQRLFFKASSKNYNKCCEKLVDTIDDEKYLNQFMLESPGENKTYKKMFRNLSNKQSRLILFLLEMLHREGEEDEYSDTLKIERFTLEHVMPKKWDLWKDVECVDESGETIIEEKNIVEVRNEAINSIGNHTLLTSKLNKAIQNDIFEIKINGKDNKKGIRGFTANMYLTKKIVEKYDSDASWNERDIFNNEKAYFDKLNNVYCFVEE